MPTLTKLKHITLHYRNDGRDEVYQCRIQPAGERFVVHFAHGRRGSTLNPGTKTNVPVEYADARRIFDQLVREKQAKGYVPGVAGTPDHLTDRRAAGSRKHQLQATAACVVAKIHVQRSVEIRLLDKDGWQNCGNVIIPAHHKIPAVGQVIEVRYLHAHAQSHALSQPVYLGPRDDVDVSECVLRQLKFKPEDESQTPVSHQGPTPPASWQR
jgi:predicted DNA-binding WGR domain protein